MWTRLGSITELITSGSRDWAKYYAETGALFLRMGNLSKDSFDLRLNNIQRVQVPKKAEGIRTALQAGDLLFSITGEVGMLGLIRIYSDCQSIYLSQIDSRLSSLYSFSSFFDEVCKKLISAFNSRDVSLLFITVSLLLEINSSISFNLVFG